MGNDGCSKSGYRQATCHFCHNGKSLSKKKKDKQKARVGFEQTSTLAACFGGSSMSSIKIPPASKTQVGKEVLLSNSVSQELCTRNLILSLPSKQQVFD